MIATNRCRECGEDCAAGGVLNAVELLLVLLLWLSGAPCCCRNSLGGTKVVNMQSALLLSELLRAEQGVYSILYNTVYIIYTSRITQAKSNV
jgi:hypothetical protein